MTPQPWRQAWHDALYGPRGFYRRPEGPAGHFATSAQGIPGVSEIVAQTVVALANQFEAGVVVDFACGRGELANNIVNFVGAETDVCAIDIVERPEHLDSRIHWGHSPGDLTPGGLEIIGGRRALVFAHEWLDVVACPVVEAAEDGTLHEVLVDDEGSESLGPKISQDDLAWLEQHNFPTDSGPEGVWPTGTRIEIGAPRDLAWARLIDEVRRNAASGSLIVGVDYSITADDAPASGTLTGFREGTECFPVPDGSCDITSHVRTDSLDLTDEPRTQREILLNLFGKTPLEPVPHALAGENPPEYLRRLTTRSAFAAATARGGLGDFVWFVHQI